MTSPVGALASHTTCDVSTPSPRIRKTMARPNPSSPTRLNHPAVWPSRLKPMARLLSAPAIKRRKVVASRIGPGCSASSSTIDSPSVTTSSFESCAIVGPLADASYPSPGLSFWHRRVRHAESRRERADYADWAWDADGRSSAALLDAHLAGPR